MTLHQLPRGVFGAVVLLGVLASGTRLIQLQA